jgi:phosphinothricin acetyltransferase
VDALIRSARSEDLAALTDIYNHYVRTSAATFDIALRTIEAQLGWFTHYTETGPHRLLVAVRANQILGYASSSRLAARQAYATSIETSVYVHADFCGQRVGTQLYAALFAALAHEDLHRAYAQVTLPNPASIALHRRFDFRELGVQDEVGRKFGRYWSVQLLEKHLT